MSPDLRSAIEYDLLHWNDPDSEARLCYEEALRIWEKKLHDLIELIERSDAVHITEKDLERRVHNA